MEKFITKKRNTSKQSEEETCVKKLMKSDHAEVATGKAGTVGLYEGSSQSQPSKLTLSRSIPTDISTSGGDKSVQPRLKDYPKHSEGKPHARSFVGAWFDKYEWAEYSQQRDAMFCFACRHFAPPGYGNTDDAFTKSGFRRRKKALGKDGSIAKYLNSHCHKSSYIAWTNYQRNKLDNSSIA